MRYLLWFFSRLFELTAVLRKYLYDAGIIKTFKIEDVYIVCVGNITAGGTGKTPLVQYIAREYVKKGKKVSVIMRGYGGKRKVDPAVVFDGKEYWCSIEESGEEAYLHALNLGVPVIVGKDRVKAAELAKKKYNSEIIIMDDGFQHRRLYRNKDILVIDATNPFGGNEYLPLGRLREPISAIQRAAEIVISKSDAAAPERVEEILSKLEVFKKNVFLSKINYIDFIDIKNNRYSLDFIKGKECIMFSGIGNPEQFENGMKKLGVHVINHYKYKDHHRYLQTDIELMKRYSEKTNCKLFITTEKDLIKLRGLTDITEILAVTMNVELQHLEELQSK